MNAEIKDAVERRAPLVLAPRSVFSEGSVPYSDTNVTSEFSGSAKFAYESVKELHVATYHHLLPN